jgi:hypothetical protein
VLTVAGDVDACAVAHSDQGVYTRAVRKGEEKKGGTEETVFGQPARWAALVS